MKRVKTPSSDLENKRGPLFFLGVIAATALVLVAFEWKTFYEQPVLFDDHLGHYLEDEVIMNAFPPARKLLPPPPPKMVVDEFAYAKIENLNDFDLVVPDMDVDDYIVEIDFKQEHYDEEKIYGSADQAPEFPGGLQAMYRYLAAHIRYPAQARRAGISGQVHVYFVVNKLGEITDVSLLNTIGGGCDEEALRVVASMPRWKPGTQGGRVVKVSYTIPISFTLR
jgi:protein TonB